MSFLQLLQKNLPSLISGLGVTIKIAFFAILLAIALGLIFGLMSMSKSKILNGISSVYTYIVYIFISN